VVAEETPVPNGATAMVTPTPIEVTAVAGIKPCDKLGAIPPRCRLEERKLKAAYKFPVSLIASWATRLGIATKQQRTSNSESPKRDAEQDREQAAILQDCGVQLFRGSFVPPYKRRQQQHTTNIVNPERHAAAELNNKPWLRENPLLQLLLSMAALVSSVCLSVQCN